jgi:ribonucleotide monophosphatase NagD (HAD superfamily)
VPDCGSIAVMLEYAVKKKPLFIGKPSPVLIELAMKKLSFTKEETVMVGDRIYTDILAGIAAGVTTICVLSGEATETDIQKSEKKPDFVFCDVGEINLFLE